LLPCVELPKKDFFVILARVRANARHLPTLRGERHLDRAIVALDALADNEAPSAQPPKYVGKSRSLDAGDISESSGTNPSPMLLDGDQNTRLGNDKAQLGVVAGRLPQAPGHYAIEQEWNEIVEILRQIQVLSAALRQWLGRCTF
jgi:hypothetical protein